MILSKIKTSRLTLRRMSSSRLIWNITTLRRMPLTRMAFSRTPIGRMPLSRTIHCRMTLSKMTHNRMKLSKMTYSKMPLDNCRLLTVLLNATVYELTKTTYMSFSWVPISWMSWFHLILIKFGGREVTLLIWNILDSQKNVHYPNLWILTVSKNIVVGKTFLGLSHSRKRVCNIDTKS